MQFQRTQKAAPLNCGVMSYKPNSNFPKKEISMKTILYVIFAILFSSQLCFANDIIITAEEIGPEIIRQDFQLAFASLKKGNGSYKSKVLYIAQYQVISVIIENKSNEILNVNPNYFTLVSNMKRSYPYSSETHGFKDKISFISMSPIQAVDVYPGTVTEGFLLFEKKYKKEKPQKIFFKTLNKLLSTDIVLDKKVKQ